MEKPTAQPKRSFTYEKHPDKEQEEYCPGYEELEYEIANVPYTTLVRCEKRHPHRQEKEQPGNRDVPVYSFVKKLATREEALAKIRVRQARAEEALKVRQENATKMVRELRQEIARRKKADEEVPF